MKPRIVTNAQIARHNTLFGSTRARRLVRGGTFLIAAALVALPFYSASSSSLGTHKTAANPSTQRLVTEAGNPSANRARARLSNYLALPMPPPVESIATYDSTCTNPKVSFNLGETVCAKIVGAPLGSAGRADRRLAWVSPYGSLAQGADITTDPQTGFYSIPLTATQTFTDSGGGTVVVDNRGTWKVFTLSAGDGSVRTSAEFTVHDPAKAFVDLSLNQAVGIVESQVGAGSGSVFELFVTNNGPDTAHDVVLSDTLSNNATFSSVVETTGLGFSCGTPSGGVFTCTLAAMPASATAHLTLSYTVNGGTSAGAIISNTASISSSATPCSPDATCEIQPNDNSSTATATVPNDVGSPNCTLDCPDNITVAANTTQGGDPGAFVTYPAAQPFGSCGAVANTPGSGSFFTVGTHIVTSNADSGDSCTFTVTVTDTNTPPPTISCPPDKSATDDGSGSATVDPGTPTTTPATGVTVTGVRSDSTPAVYDENGVIVTPAVVVPLNAPYPTGVTIITWTVSDSVGRTASCTQRINVHAPCASDTAPPTITAPADISVGTGPNSTTCGAVLDDELGTAVAHDDCSATVTSTGIPAGNLFPIGTTNVVYTATDGSGHTASATQHVTVTDNTPPQIAAPANASYTCPSEVPAASASQAHGTNPDLVNGGPVFDNCGSPSVTVSQSSSGAGSAANPLIITRTYTALDTHGNSASAVQTITVIDPTPPTFTFVPANVTAFTGPGATSCGTVVSDATLGTATATDNCSVTVTRTGVPAGNAFPKGNTTITYTATDGAGNTATATQTVTVIDNTPPTITCQADIIADFDPAVNGATVNYTAPVGADNCPGATTVRTAGLASGSTFPLGTTTNTFTVTDAVGNTASCSFKVTVAVTSIIGLDSVSITGSGLADSYDSTGGYPATKGSLANILSNGTITVGGSGKVFGNVRSTRVGVSLTGTAQVTGNATAGTTVSKAASAVVGGTITNNALAPVMTMPSVPACSPFSSSSGITGTFTYNSSTGDLTLSGVNIATLANGTYCFHNVSLSNSAQLKVNGPVTIKMTGTLSTSGATSLPNTTLIPSNLRILSSFGGSNGITFGNSSSLQLVVYAPNTNVSITGSAPLFGTVVGKTITLSNSGMIHYDTQLKSIWPDVWTLIFGP